MSRAERIEAAARALLAASSRIEAETMCVVPRRLVDALRSALAAQPAQAGEAVAYEIIDAAGRHIALRRTLQAAKSWVRAGTGWTVRPLVPAPSRPGGA